jgi:hypothetical protein
MIMDFSDSIKRFALEAKEKLPDIQSEEATKTALILPFFRMLGYDDSIPKEFVPEYTAVFGDKKDAWVDYAILDNGQPIILIEAKHCGVSLEKHDAQLAKYFAAAKTARFGILTNGIEYRFFSDTKDKYLMDSKPFMEFNLLNLDDSVIPHIRLFCKDTFDTSDTSKKASELIIFNEIKGYFREQFESKSGPSDDFVKAVLSRTYEGQKSKAAIEKFRPIVQKALRDWVKEMMSQKFDEVLNKEAEELKDSPRPPTKIELEGYRLVKDMLVDCCDISEISYHTTTNYIVISYEKDWKWICRLRFVEWGENHKSISFPDAPNTRLRVETLDDIFGTYKDQIVAALKMRMGLNSDS